MQQISAKHFSNYSAKSAATTLWGSTSQPTVTTEIDKTENQIAEISSVSATSQLDDQKFASISATSCPSTSTKFKPNWTPSAITNEKLPLPTSFVQYIISNRISDHFKTSKPETSSHKSKLPIPENSPIFIPPSRISPHNLTTSNLPLATTMRPLPQSVEVFPTPRPENIVEKGAGRRSSVRGSESHRRGSYISSEPTSNCRSSFVSPESMQTQQINAALNINAATKINSTANSENIIQLLLPIHSDFIGINEDNTTFIFATRAITDDVLHLENGPPSLPYIDLQIKSRFEALSILSSSEAATSEQQVESDDTTFVLPGKSKEFTSELRIKTEEITPEFNFDPKVKTSDLQAYSEWASSDPDVESKIESPFYDVSDLHQSSWWQVVSTKPSSSIEKHAYSILLSLPSNLSSTVSQSSYASQYKYGFFSQFGSADIAHLYQSSWWKVATLPQLNFFKDDTFGTQSVLSMSKSFTYDHNNFDIKNIDQLTEQLIQDVIKSALSELESLSIIAVGDESATADAHEVCNAEAAAQISLVESRVHLNPYVDQPEGDAITEVKCDLEYTLDSKINKCIAGESIQTYPSVITAGQRSMTEVSTSKICLESQLISEVYETSQEPAMKKDDLEISSGAFYLMESMADVSTAIIIGYFIKIADVMVENLMNELMDEEAFSVCLSHDDSFEVANLICEELFCEESNEKVNQFENLVPVVSIVELGGIDHVTDAMAAKIINELNSDQGFFEGLEATRSALAASSSDVGEFALVNNVVNHKIANNLINELEDDSEFFRETADPGSALVLSSSEIGENDHSIDSMAAALINEANDEKEFSEDSTAPDSAVAVSSSQISKVAVIYNELIDAMVNNLIIELKDEPEFFKESAASGSALVLSSSQVAKVVVDDDKWIDKMGDNLVNELKNEQAFVEISATVASSRSAGADNDANHTLVDNLINELKDEQEFIKKSGAVILTLEDEDGVIVVDDSMSDNVVDNLISELVSDLVFLKEAVPSITCSGVVDDMIFTMNNHPTVVLSGEKVIFEETEAVVASSEIDENLNDVDDMIDNIINNLIIELECEREFLNDSASFIKNSKTDDFVVDKIGVTVLDELDVKIATIEKAALIGDSTASTFHANLEQYVLRRNPSNYVPLESELFVIYENIETGNDIAEPVLSEIQSSVKALVDVSNEQVIARLSISSPKEVLPVESPIAVTFEAIISALTANSSEDQFSSYESTKKVDNDTECEDCAVNNSAESEFDYGSGSVIDFAVSDDSEVLSDFDDENEDSDDREVLSDFEDENEDTQNKSESSTSASIVADDMPYDISHFYECNETEQTEGDSASSKALALEGMQSPRDSIHSMRSTSSRLYGFISRADIDFPMGTPRRGIRAESASFEWAPSSLKLPSKTSGSNVESERFDEVKQKINYSSLLSETTSSSDTSNQTQMKMSQLSTQFFRDNQLRRTNPSTRIRVASTLSTTPGRLPESSQPYESIDPTLSANQALSDTNDGIAIATLVASNNTVSILSTATLTTTEKKAMPQFHSIAKTATLVHIDCTPLAVPFKSNKMIFDGSLQLKVPASDSNSTAPATPYTPSQSSPAAFSPKPIEKVAIEVKPSNVFNKLLSFWEKPVCAPSTYAPSLIATSGLTVSAKRSNITERYLASFSKT